jgi:hypothetical protein
MKFNTLFIAAASLLVGCGVPDDRLITEIDDDLWARICANSEVAYDSEEIIESCPDGVEVTVEAKSADVREAECLATFSGTASWTEPECTSVTFGDWKDYFNYEGDLCDMTDVSPSPLTACLGARM